MLLRHQVLDGIFELQVGNQVITLAAEGFAGFFGEAVVLPSAPHKADSKPARRKGTEG